MKCQTLFSGKNKIYVSSAELAGGVVKVKYMCMVNLEFLKVHTIYVIILDVFLCNCFLTLVMLNPDIPCLCKQCSSALFANQYVNLYQQSGSSNLIG